MSRETTENDLLIGAALCDANEERYAASVADAKRIIHRISSLRETRDDLNASIGQLQKELRELTTPDILAADILGS